MSTFAPFGALANRASSLNLFDFAITLALGGCAFRFAQANFAPVLVNVHFAVRPSARQQGRTFLQVYKNKGNRTQFPAMSG